MPRLPFAVRMLFPLLALVGAILLVGAIFVTFNKISYLQSAVTTTGTVVRLVGDDTKKSVAEYQADGQTYTVTSSVSSSPPAYRVGDTVKITYPAGSPSQGQINSILENWFVSIFLGMMGSAFFAVGGGMTFIQWRRQGIISKLKTSGMALQTEYQSVVVNTSFTVNGRHPYQVVSQYLDSNGQVHVFKSENLWFNPEKYISQDEITVLVDPNNFKQYYMDVSFLPKMAE